MTTSTNSNHQSNDLIQRLIKNLTNFANSVDRLRRHSAENKNFIVDEMCRHKNETDELIKSLIKYVKNIEDAITLVALEQQKLLDIITCIVHHYQLNNEQED